MAGKPSDDIEQYKRVLTESGLVNENQLHSVLDELEQEHGNRPGDSTILARRLIDRKMVTPWQNTHLLQRDQAWWRNILGKFFEVGWMEQRGPELYVVVGPKAKAKKKVKPQAKGAAA